jgi:hypothetical protein
MSGAHEPHWSEDWRPSRLTVNERRNRGQDRVIFFWMMATLQTQISCCAAESAAHRCAMERGIGCIRVDVNKSAEQPFLPTLGGSMCVQMLSSQTLG